MSLGEAVLFVLHYLRGRATSQYVINIRLFFYYMWLTDSVYIRPLKFVPSEYGPICTRLQKTLEILEEHEYLSSQYSSIMFDDPFDRAINEKVYGKSSGYLLLPKGSRSVQPMGNHTIYRINQYLGDDVLTLWETVKNTYPELVRSTHEYKSNSKDSKHKGSHRSKRK